MGLPADAPVPALSEEEKLKGKLGELGKLHMDVYSRLHDTHNDNAKLKAIVEAQRKALSESEEKLNRFQLSYERDKIQASATRADCRKARAAVERMQNELQRAQSTLTADEEARKDAESRSLWGNLVLSWGTLSLSLFLVGVEGDVAMHFRCQLTLFWFGCCARCVSVTDWSARKPKTTSGHERPRWNPGGSLNGCKSCVLSMRSDWRVPPQNSKSLTSN